MNRFAIGYSPKVDQLDRPIFVFIELPKATLVQQRGDAGPKQIDKPFDVVLDSYSTRCFIRTVTEFEPEYMTSMLTADESWDVLPRPGARVPA
ncbi:MAG: hypothetical protein ACXVFE_03550 [Gaiellaceae bacterium]